MRFTKTLALSALLGTGAAFGGEAIMPAPVPEDRAWSGDWCAPLKGSLGLKAEGREPWLWDVKMFGRLQFQYAYLDGQDRNGDDFHYDTTEFRRFYLGGQARFLNYFQVVGRAVMENDRRPVGGDREWGYQGLWDLAVKTDVKKMFGIEGVDSLVVGYGKKQLNVSDEWHTSSKYIKTIERSSIANYVWPRSVAWNPTGAWVDVKQGDWKGTVGVFSTAFSKEFSDWDEGLLYYGEVFRSFDHSSAWMPEQVNLAGFWQDVDTSDQKLTGGMEWVGSLAGAWELGPWNIRGNVMLGENGGRGSRGGQFWGLVVMPSIWIVPEKLDFVMRYQYAGSEEDEGIQMWSRYARRAAAVDTGIDINGGRGDEHHNFYLGLNYYLCDDNLKIMGGIEYDDLSSGGTDVYEGWTATVAVRTYF